VFSSATVYDCIDSVYRLRVVYDVTIVTK